MKIKVRQPLAELKVQPASDADRRAVERFADQVAGRTQFKRVALHGSDNGALLSFEVKPNPKNMGPKFANRLKAVQAALAARDPNEVADLVLAGKSIELACNDGPAVVEPTDLWVLPELAPGLPASPTAAPNSSLTPESRPRCPGRSGARSDPPRSECAQGRRVEMEDRIALYLGTDSAALAAAIKTHL